MEKYLKTLQNTELFSGIDDTEMYKLLQCLKPRVSGIQKGGIFFSQGDKVNDTAVVLEGKVQLYSDDFFGNRNIITEIEKGGVFAEALPFTKNRLSPVSAMAAQNSEVMYISHDNILNRCAMNCSFHNSLLENLMRTVSEKNLLLTKKNGHISKRTIKARLFSYLSERALEAGGSKFEIPFNRQELADYLCVDRSALSAELSRLAKQGKIKYQKNKFELLGSF